MSTGDCVKMNVQAARAAGRVRVLVEGSRANGYPADAESAAVEASFEPFKELARADREGSDAQGVTWEA